jgi:hypothetical protein
MEARYRSIARTAIALCASIAGGSNAAAQPVGSSEQTAPPRTLFAGPFQSSRLFSMPIADVLGAYQMSISGDGSLLQSPGLLTSSGVLAIGFGDIAQLEYRNSGAVGITGAEAPIPSIGVQLKLPLPYDSIRWPAFAAAFRLGVPRRERVGGDFIDESVTDLYLVGRQSLWGPLRNINVHGGVRISSAKATVGSDSGTQTPPVSKLLYLPAGGWEIVMNDQSRLVGEVALAPQFSWDPTTTELPKIDYGILGRLGLRWAIVPAFTLDATVGYQVDITQMGQAESLRSLVAWDIRIGGEVFVPWGALACRGIGVFCNRNK